MTVYDDDHDEDNKRGIDLLLMTAVKCAVLWRCAADLTQEQLHQIVLLLLLLSCTELFTSQLLFQSFVFRLLTLHRTLHTLRPNQLLQSHQLLVFQGQHLLSGEIELLMLQLAVA